MRRGWCAFLLLSVGCLGWGVRPATESGTSERVVTRPEAEVKRDGRKTQAYWKKLGQALSEERTIRSPEPPAPMEAILYVIGQQIVDIQGLDPLDVDAEVLDLSSRLVAFLRHTAETLPRLRWYHGLGWPLPAECQQLRPTARTLSRDMEDLRVRLTQRYRLDFPVLDFPDGLE